MHGNFTFTFTIYIWGVFSLSSEDDKQTKSLTDDLSYIIYNICKKKCAFKDNLSIGAKQLSNKERKGEKCHYLNIYILSSSQTI